MSTREERARWNLENYRLHREWAQENLQDLQNEKSRNKAARYAWEVISLHTLAVVNVDSVRLLNAVNAVFDLAIQYDEDIPVDVLLDAVVTALTPNEELDHG